MGTTPVDRTTAAKSSLAIVATFACLACALSLIVATIVLSLIPIFVADKDVTLNSNAKKTHPIQLQLAINDTNTVSFSSRRKRTLNDSYTGCIFGSAGLSIIRSRLFLYVKNPVVQDIVMLSTSITAAPTTTSYKHLLNIVFFITFVDICAYRCQLSNVGSIYSSIANGTVSGRTINGIDLYKNGAPFGYLRLSVAAIFYLSAITPGLSVLSRIYATTLSSNSTGNTSNTTTVG